jgi:hypothetical protein
VPNRIRRIIVDATTLLANKGSRRTSVLSTEDEALSVRSKLFSGDEDAVLQLRIWLEPMGHYVHLYLDTRTGALLASTTGKQDQDAYDRGANELQRRGITLA